MRRLILCVAVVLCCAVRVEATELTFDFDSGLGPNFSLFDDSNGLFSVDTDGPNVRIHKQADDGSFNRTHWIHAGVLSSFLIDGDFTITVDYALDDWQAVEPRQLTESLFSILSDDDVFTVLRLLLGHNDYKMAASSIGGGINITPESSRTGRYRIERSGSTVTGLLAPLDSSTFIPIGSIDGLDDPVRIRLMASQGPNLLDEPRSTTALDISFDNLIIQADTVTGLVPEPSTIILLLTGALGVIAYSIKRRRP